MSRKQVVGLFGRLIPVVAVLALLAWATAPGLAYPEVAAADEPTSDWIRQFGSAGNDSVSGIAVDSSGVYVVGQSGAESFVRKYDANGNLAWTRYTDSGYMYAPSVAVDSGAVYVCEDGVVREYDPSGNEMWVCYMEDEDYHYYARAVSADSSGVYILATIRSVSSGDYCGSVARKYDSNGNKVWIRDIWHCEYGNHCFCSGICSDSSGVDVSFDSYGDHGADGFVRKYDTDGNEVWLRPLGLEGNGGLDSTWAISADATGVYLAGEEEGSLSNTRQVFVRKYDANGNEIWLRHPELGDYHDRPLTVSAYAGRIYLAGSTSDALFGQTTQGGDDAFVCEYDPNGNQVCMKQFGSSGNDAAWAVAASDGGLYIGGGTDGSLPGCSSQGLTDAFLSWMTVNAAPAKPFNTLPGDMATGLGLTPTLQFSAFSDPDEGDIHAASQWQITTTADNYTGPVFDSGVDTSNLTQITLPFGALSYSSTYYWRVRHQDSRGAWSEWSAETSFTTLPGWQLQNAPLRSDDLHGVWGSSSRDVFAAGDHGSIMHYDGEVWVSMTSGTASNLNAIWGTSATDVLAAGDHGTIVRYDGSKWRPVPVDATADFNAIWGSSSSDVFAAGWGVDENGSGYGLILHYDGSGWSPIAGADRYRLNGLWGSSCTDVFAVGADGAILHYDGGSWTPMYTGTAQSLKAIWGSSSSDVFAAGTAGTILHYDGSAWSAMESGTSNTLTGVRGSPPCEVFAVGDDGIILRYDSSAWNTMTSGTTNDLTGIWGSGSSVFAVGDNCTILHYGGAVMPETTSSAATNVAATSAVLNGTLTSLGSPSSVQVSFEWGLTADYGNITTPETMTGTGAFSSAISNLVPATTYHFRAVAVGNGIVYGDDMTFATAAEPVVPSADPPSHETAPDTTPAGPDGDPPSPGASAGDVPSGGSSLAQDGVSGDDTLETVPLTVDVSPDPAANPGGSVLDETPTPAQVWMYPVAVIGAFLGLGAAASFAVWLRYRLAT